MTNFLTIKPNKLTVLIAVLVFVKYTAALAIANQLPPQVDYPFEDSESSPPELEVNPTPPELKNNTPPEQDPNPNPNPTPTPTPTPIPGTTSAETSIKLTKVGANPEKFNPLTGKTKIIYTVSAKAKIDVKIIKASGGEVLKLAHDEIVEAGDYFVWWNGTDSKGSDGEVVKQGEYMFIVIAKDPQSGVSKDEKSGGLEVFYEKSVQPTPPETNIPTEQTLATIQLQNAKSGVVAETGPEVLIYLVFPVTGYLVFQHVLKK